ncbi:MAG TPA: alpha/beta fold hydrolase [Actinomycetales bacterium]|nr:alpha/beta fold hydrolase [Actinomycetales bacterium]
MSLQRTERQGRQPGARDDRGYQSRPVGLGGALLRGAGTLLSPSGLRGAAVETMWVGTHVALYPWGLVGGGLRAVEGAGHRFGVGHLPPVQRGLLIGDVEAAGTPILLVHGMVDNRSIFTLLRRGLLRRGFGRVLTLNYSPLTGDVRAAARDLAERVEQLVADTGYERVHVIGHSLGGLIARYYVQRLGGHERVHSLVTLGTPHGGTSAARLLPATTLGRQLRPGSELVAELAEPAPEVTTRFVAYWSDLDQLIIPKRNARIVHGDLRVRNELVRRVGHMSLPIDPRVVHGVSTELAQLGADGTTSVPGVAALHHAR